MRPARIVALALIALVMLALGFLKLRPHLDAIHVPRGAHAGQLALKSCTYAGYAADCGTLVVPENRANPRSRLIAIPVTRVRARSSHSAAPVFRLEGGPGLTNMDFPRVSWFAGDRDVVLVGYRGVDGSERLDCPEVRSALRHSTDVLAAASLRAYADGLRACGSRLTRSGIDLAGYNFAAQADDLEAARTALRYDRIDLVSESAGTRLAMIYAWRHPTGVHRSVMIGVNPPGHFMWDPQTADRQIVRYAELCADDAACGRRTDDLAASINATNADLPDRWGILPIKAANVRVGSFMSLFETTPNATPNAPTTLDAWLSAAEGDASGLWATSLMGDLMFPDMFVWGEYISVGQPDREAARDYFAAGTPSGLAGAATTFAWGGGRAIDAWPVAPDPYGTAQSSTVDTLLVGGELDLSTPPGNATRDLLPYLPNGHQVVRPAFGHSGSFWADQPDAGRHLVTTFLDSGRVDDSRYRPAAIDFMPAVSLAAIAKIIVGSLAGLALLMLLSLLLMARHGTFGRTAGALFRSLYAAVLGVGGWSLGALLVLTAMPGLRVDDMRLTVVSMGVPVGLGAFLAWSGRGRRFAGLAAAVGGALAGAWLGFHATNGSLALVTALAGAIAGANLLLLVLDIARDRTAVPATAAPAPVLTPVG